MTDLNKLSTAALKAAMTGGTSAWGTWGSSEAHTRYMEPLPKTRRRRMCRCGCRKRHTHVGKANGIGLFGGCELTVARWVRSGRP